jgi:parallel beta-helix repeat protein
MRTFTRISIFLLFLFITSASWSQVVYVNGSYEGSVSDGTSWDTPFKTIQEAIDAAQPGDSIWIAKGEYNTPEGSDGYTVDKSLLIFGGFDGTETSFSYRNHKGNVTSLISGDGITIRNLFNIKNDDLKFILDGLSISQCQSIVQMDDFEKMELNLKSCKIVNLGGFNLKNAELKLDSCDIENTNYIAGSYRNVQFNNCSINNNQYLFQGDCFGDFIISTCQFDSVNAIFVGGGDPKIKMENSKVNNLNFSVNGLFTGTFLSLDIINSQIINHRSALFHASYNAQKIKIENCNFKNNGNNGNFFTCYTDLADVSIKNSNFENFSGSITGKFNSLKVEKNNFLNGANFYFVGEVEKEVIVDECTFENIVSPNQSIFNLSGNANFALKKSSVRGLEIGQFFSFDNLNGYAEIQNCDFLSNKSSDKLFSGNSLKGFTINNSEFKYNTANGLYYSSSGGTSRDFLKVLNSNFIDNQIGFSSNFYVSYVDEIKIDGCNFIYSSLAPVADILISLTGPKNTFISNTSFKKCHFNKLIDIYSGERVIIENLSVEDSQFELGAALSLRVDEFNIKKSSFKNIIIKTPSGFVGTQLISCTNSNFKLQGCSFDNITSLNGPAVFYAAFENENRGEISNCVFQNNTSKGSAGVIYSTIALAIDNSKFINNHNDGQGGVIYQADSLLLKDCLFENNSASTNGVLTVYGSLKSINSIFKNNKSLNDAGVIGGTGGVYNFYNNLFINNSAKNHPIIYALYNTAYFDNCLFYGNYGDQENYLLRETIPTNNSSKIYARNSIFWNNPSSKLLADIQYSDIQGGLQGNGNLDLDPKFADPENGDFRLLCESPLINKGFNQFALHFPDSYGTPRIVADTVDMGPYEFPGDPNVSKSIPDPDFTFSNGNPCIKEMIALQNVTPQKKYYTYKWNVGDGAALLTAVDTSYSFKNSGKYQIELIATNACGTSVSKLIELEVKPSFIPSISFPTSVVHDDTVSFTSNSSCSNLSWTVIGGSIQNGNGTKKILVKWGDGNSGSGKVKLLATNCGDESVCEFPVEIDIPIMPASNPIVGNMLVCQGTSSIYKTLNRSYVPGALYTWSTKGGTINGRSSGYGLDSVSISWNKNENKGVVYLNIKNELLKNTITDSLVVNLRPMYHIQNSKLDFCVKSEYVFSTDIGGSFKWNISGALNQMEALTGKAKFGSNDGEYFIAAYPVDSTSFCNWSDTLMVNVHTLPVVDSVVGVQEVNITDAYIYQAYSSGEENDIKWEPLNSSYNLNGNPTSVVWQFGGPFGFNVFAESKISGCISDPFLYEVKPDFVYTIAGPEDLCIATTHSYSVNEDPLNEEIFTWKINGKSIGTNNNTISAEFLTPGYNTLDVTILRKGKTYTVSKRIYVNHIPGEVTVKGPRKIKSEGGGTYEYIVSKPIGLDLQLSITGAQTYSLVDTVLTVTWNAESPYQIEVSGTKVGNACTTIPFKLVVTKASILSTDVLLNAGTLCPNALSTYTIEVDELVEDVQWNLSGGGTITNIGKGFATIQWGENAGTYNLSVTYKRFGNQLISKDIVINAAPQPIISDAVICGETPVNLTTLLSYKSYSWTQEPEGTNISAQSKISISKGGIYSVKVVDQNGCTGVASRNILAVPNPIAKITSSVSNSCIENATRPVSLMTVEGSDYVYEWLVDGQNVNNNNPIYAFTQNLSIPGSHTYKVKVTSAGVCTAEDSKTLVVYTPGECPTSSSGCSEWVDFAVSGYQPFTFDNKSNQSKGFTWSFGDGSSSQVSTSVSHSYSNIGIYNVVLRNGCAIVQRSVKVPVLARFAAREVVCQLTETEFSDFSVNLPGYPITSWSWDFGDGTSSGEKKPKHTFKDFGNFNVTLTVTVNGDNGEILSDRFTKEIVVAKTPIVDFLVQNPACNSDLFVFFDKSVFTSSYAIYNWDLGSNLKFGIPNPSSRYSPGSKQISLKVTDLLGCTSNLSKTIEVSPPVEKKKVSVSGNQNICFGDSVLLKAPLSTGNYIWRNGGVQINKNSQEIYAKEIGSYTVEYTESSCQLVTDAIDLKVFELKKSVITFNGPSCEGNSLNLSISGINSSEHSVLWKQDLQTLSYASPEFTIPSLTQLNAGFYSAIIEEKASGCEYQIPSKQLLVYAQPVKPLLVSPNPNACFDQKVEVSYSNPLSNPYTLSWFANNNIISSEVTDKLLVNNSSSNLFIKLKVTEDISGCTATSDEFPVVLGKEVQLKVSDNIHGCEQTFASINTNLKSDEYDFQWYHNGVLTTNTIGRIDFESLAQSDTGSYYAIATSKAVNGNVAGCIFKSDTARVTVKFSPAKPEISGDKEFCSGNSVVLQSSVTDNILWSTGETASAITVYEKGVYSVTATDISTGCQSKSTISIIENPVPDFRFLGTGVYEFCGSEPLKLNGLSVYPSFQWKLNGIDYGKPNKDLYPRKSGSYTVFATTDKGCVGESDTLRVKSLPCACIVVTTEDGLNIGSLRDAINCANTKAGPDNISFAIEGVGPHAILLDSILPVIKEIVVIDGFSQSSDNVYDIIIKGGGYKANGLIQASGVTESEFRGLQFEGLDNAISLDFGNDDNTIEKNRFIGITKQAINLSGFIKNAIVKDNYFEGTGSGEAIHLSYVAQSTFSNNTIKNVGSAISLVKSNKNTIKDNTISLIKQNGISLTSSSTGNTLSGNTILNIDSSAVLISASNDNTLKGNYIGITKQGQSGLVKQNGVKTETSANTVITANVIAGVVKNGVYTFRMPESMAYMP